MQALWDPEQPVPMLAHADHALAVCDALGLAGPDRPEGEGVVAQTLGLIAEPLIEPPQQELPELVAIFRIEVVDPGWSDGQELDAMGGRWRDGTIVVGSNADGASHATAARRFESVSHAPAAR